MIPRQLRPGQIVLVDENEAWREILVPGSRPTIPEPQDWTPVFPGDDALCVVRDLSADEESNGRYSAADIVIKAFRETEPLAKTPEKPQDARMVGETSRREDPGGSPLPPSPSEWRVRYPVGHGEFMVVAKDSPPTLHQLRMLIKWIQLAIEAEETAPPAPVARGASEPGAAPDLET